jgi:hypothetical protein
MGWTWLVVVLGVAVDWLPNYLWTEKTRHGMAWHGMGPRDWQLPSTAKNPLPYRCLAANHQLSSSKLQTLLCQYIQIKFIFYCYFSPKKDPKEGRQP